MHQQYEHSVTSYDDLSNLGPNESGGDVHISKADEVILLDSNNTECTRYGPGVYLNHAIFDSNHTGWRIHGMPISQTWILE